MMATVTVRLVTVIVRGLGMAAVERMIATTRKQVWMIAMPQTATTLAVQVRAVGDADRASELAAARWVSTQRAACVIQPRM